MSQSSSHAFLPAHWFQFDRVNLSDESENRSLNENT